MVAFGFFIPGLLNKCVASQGTEDKEVTQRTASKGQTSSHLCEALLYSLSHTILEETSTGLPRIVKTFTWSHTASKCGESEFDLRSS